MTAAPAEAAGIRLKRLRLRSGKRGIKEMDLILTHYAERRLADLPEPQIACYDALLHENDHDIYGWVTGQAAAPERYAALIADIARVFAGR